jgi:hypothetical protein
MTKKTTQTSLNTRKPRVDPAGRMTKALLKKCKELRRLYVEAEENDIKARRAFAVACCDICHDTAYGDRAVENAADHLGLDPSTIRDYAAVVDAWSDEAKFLKEASAKDKFLKPLSWSHFVEVAQVKDGRVRRSLLTSARKEGWSVRELKKAIRERTSGANTPAPQDSAEAEQPAAPSPLKASATQLSTVLGDQLPKQIRDASAEDLDAALEELKTLRDKLDLCIQQLEERRKLEARKGKASRESKSK